MTYPCTLPGCPGHAVEVSSHTLASAPVPAWVYRADTPPPADPDPVWQPVRTRRRVWLAAALVAVLVVIGLRRYAS